MGNQFPEWFELFAIKLTEAIHLISAAGTAMADEPSHPRTAIAHINAAINILKESGVSVEKWVDKKGKKDGGA